LCGVLGVRLVGRDGDQQPSRRYFPTPLNVFLMRTGLARRFPRVKLIDDAHWDPSVSGECDWVPGCYYLMPRRTIDQVGLFDPRYFLYSEEVDHCRRVKAAGLSVNYFAETSVVHIGGESARSDSAVTASGSQISSLQIESELLYFRKHHGWSGVVASLGLTALADLLLACKSLLKAERPEAIVSHLRHLATVARLCAKTRFGAQPTR
jgi:GT2 family glycosyltransferase